MEGHKGIVGLSTKTADELGLVPLQFRRGEKWDSLGREKKGIFLFLFLVENKRSCLLICLPPPALEQRATGVVCISYSFVQHLNG